MIILPVYYTFQKKKYAEPSTILVGLNEVYKMHHIHKNKMTKWYYNLIFSKINRLKISGQIKTHYTYFYKNSQSDAPNVVAVIDKIFMDALQIKKTIKEDNVLNYIGSTWEVGEQDKLNPRIEIKIYEVS